MSHTLTAILMLSSMLSHTLLGCGWHHAHECHAGENHSCQTIKVCDHGETDAHHDHEHGHHHAEPQSEQPPAQPQSDPCQEGRCAYLVSSSVKVMEESSQFVDLLPAFDLLVTAQEKQYAEQMFRRPFSSAIAPPGVRAQAQTTVWLL